MKKIDYKFYEKPSDYLKFQVGKTTIQIISNGVLAKKHGMKTAFSYIPLGICTEKPDCQFCLQGNEPKQKWMWIAYKTDKKEPKLLDAGPMLGDEICSKAALWGDPQEYEIVVTKTGTGRTTKYSAEKGEKSKTTEEEKKQLEPTKQYLIKKHFQSN